VQQELLSVGLPDPVLDSIRRVARLYLQQKIELGDLAERLREEKLPAAGSDESEAFPEAVIVAIEPGLRGILDQQDREAIEPARVQETAGQLMTGIYPELRQIYGRATDLIPEDVVERLLSLLDIQGDNTTILKSLRDQLGDYPEAVEGISELEAVSHYLDLLGVPGTAYKVDVSMARGLEYYTGPIYETIVEEANVGSVTGGGRYDNLIGMFLDRSLPATGTTIGIERLIVVMEDQDMFPPSIGKTATQVLVTTFQDTLLDESIKVAAMLRQAGLRAQIYFDADPLREQIGYANNKDIPLLVIIGPDEAAKGQLTVRKLSTKQQQTVNYDQATDLIRTWLE
jgi:histidyl-tRNA synthetase